MRALLQQKAAARAMGWGKGELARKDPAKFHQEGHSYHP